MRFGLFGTGPFAEMVHGPGLASHPEVELVGVWGRNPDKAALLAARLGTEPYSDRARLLSEVEAVDCCLPPDIQARLAVEAADQGRHLLLEKPLALSTSEAAAVDRAVKGAGVAAIIFYTALYDPQFRSFFSELSAGDWLTADIVMLGSIFDGVSPFGASPWRREKGALWDIGPHSLAWASAALGLPLDTTCRRGRGDLVHLAVLHESGATSSHTLSLTAPPASHCTSATYFGHDGTTRMPQLETDAAGAFEVALDQLMASARSGEKHPLGTHHGLAVVRALEQAEASGGSATSAAGGVSS